MRKHYMTLNFRGNVEVTHINKNGNIEVTFEQAVNSGFNTLVLDINGIVLSNTGFNNSDIDYFIRFLNRSKSAILQESRGEI